MKKVISEYPSVAEYVLIKNVRNKFMMFFINMNFRPFLLGFSSLIVFLLYNVNVAQAQPDPPSLRCIAVETNGNVTLTWRAPVDTGTAFGGYHIYTASSAAGPFNPVDSIFQYSTLTTTITSVNANASPLFFYIKTREGCCNNYSVSSDTLKSMKMIVTSLSNETVRLTWNRIHNPPLPSTVSSFSLSKELTAGIFTVFRTTLDTSSTDTNIVCSKFINYKVTQGDLSGCQSVSSIDGEFFRDTKGPAVPVIDTVSVDYMTGEANISWLADSSLDTQGYIIYLFNGIAYDSIGAVYGINNLSFTYLNSQSNNLVETFSVAAFDSCRNLGSLAVNHHTIYLQSSFTKCGATASLNWNSYVNLISGIQRYEIWVSENNGPWIRDGFVPPTTTSYTKQLTNQGSQYDFYIRAIGNDSQTLSSNMVSVIADIFDLPEFIYIRSASVSGSSVQLSVWVDDTADVVSYKLYSADASSGPFILAGEQSYTPVQQIYFTDVFAGADQRQKFYLVTSTDSCGEELVKSNIAGTVFLSATGGDDFTSHLTWLDYIGWQGPTGHFNIYRVINGIRESMAFASVSGDTLLFSEQVSNLLIDNGNLCYVVEAVEESINSYGFLDSAFSNIACAPQPSSAYIPNAFTPGGKNPVFGPYTLFADPANYVFQVYNRWGQQVFKSSSPGEGWDGTYNNTNAPSGVYVYRLVFKGFNQKEISRTGTVTLLR